MNPRCRTMAAIMAAACLGAFPAFAGDLAVDDFDDGDLRSPLGATWAASGDFSADSATRSRISVAASKGRPGRDLVFDYALKSTPAHPWPDCGVTLAFGRDLDVSSCDGIVLRASSSRQIDKVTLRLQFGSPDGRFVTDYEAELRLSPRSGLVAVPFSALFPGSWFVMSGMVMETPNYSRLLKLEIGKKGSSGESGQVFIDDLRFYAGEPGAPIQGDIPMPVHSTLPEKGAAPGPAVKVTVECAAPFIDPDSHLGGNISPLLYGADVGMLGLPAERVAPLGLKSFRMGGGTGVNWRNGKVASPDGKAYPAYDVADFVAYCRAIGAEPIIEFNLIGYAPDERDGVIRDCMDASDAADLVTYLNGDLGLGVRYFQGDNEFEVWHESYSAFWKGGPCTSKEYFRRFAAASLAMKAAQEAVSGNPQDISIIGPEISSSWTFYRTKAGTDDYDGLGAFPPWFLREARALELDPVRNPRRYRPLDVLSFHLYPVLRENMGSPYNFRSMDSMLESSRVWWDRRYVNQYCDSLPRDRVCAVIPTFNRWIREYYPGLGLAVTEFGIDPDPGIPYEDIVRVLYQADLYGIMATYGVDIATQHTLNDDAYLGLMGLHGSIRPQYYPLQLYARHFRGAVLKAISGAGDVGAYACDDGEGGIIVMAVNRGASARRADLVLRGLPGGERKITVALDARSLTCIRMDKASNPPVGEVWRYGAAQMP